MLRFLPVITLAICVVSVVRGQDAVDTMSSGCGCCPSPYCRLKSVACSTNADCECLWMTMSGGGMCADTLVSCADLIRCDNDNQTCSTPNTVCVNNTRCQTPVCYPIERASSQRCPPLRSTMANSTTTLSTTTSTTSTTTITTTTSTPSILGRIDSFSGVQLNFTPSSLSGAWSSCYTAPYITGMPAATIASILASCNKTRLLLGCRPVSSIVLTVAAMGNRANVLFNCNSTKNCTYVANGVGWYFSNSYSWGFVNGSDSVTRDSCDTDLTNSAYRLCWHTGDSGGYRCGTTLGLNSDTTWQKVIYHAN